MTTGTHDTLVYRLAQILVKLNQGEKLDLQALADEFGVNLRTVQRDLNLRFAYLPLQKRTAATISNFQGRISRDSICNCTKWHETSSCGNRPQGPELNFAPGSGRFEP